MEANLELEVEGGSAMVAKLTDETPAGLLGNADHRIREAASSGVVKEPAADCRRRSTPIADLISRFLSSLRWSQRAIRPSGLDLRPRVSATVR